MKILLTGAHFTPAVAVIEHLKKIRGVDLVYVGRNTTLEGDQTKSVESQLLPTLGVKFIPIITGRLQRSFTVYTIPSLLKIPIGLLQAIFIMLSEKPDVILSFGGYVAIPVVVVSWFFSIPIIIHEQSLVPGLANKISSFFANKVAVAFKNNSFAGEKVIVTGNPVRKKVVEISRHPTKEHSGLPIVLILGGNQGSHVLNLAVEKSLDQLLKIAIVYHQTGDSKYQDFERASRLQNKNYQVFKFINENWAEILAKSDLVVSRAGINTLTELALLGKPTLLVPISTAEQHKNANFFEDLGLARVLPQSQLQGDSLLKNIKTMLKNLKNLKEEALEAKKIVVPDAAQKLVLETILLAENFSV